MLLPVRACVRVCECWPARTQFEIHVGVLYLCMFMCVHVCVCMCMCMCASLRKHTVVKDAFECRMLHDECLFNN